MATFSAAAAYDGISWRARGAAHWHGDAGLGVGEDFGEGNCTRDLPLRSRGSRHRAGCCLTGLAVALVSPSGLPAAADPPLTVAEAKAQIEQLEIDAAAIDQEYVAVEEQIDRGRAKLKLKQADVKAQTTQVARLKYQVGQVALAHFQNRDLDTAAQLFVTPDTEGFLSQISTVEKVSENQNSALQDYQQQQATLADLQLSAEADLAALSEQEKQLKTLRAASKKKIAESKSVLARLSAEEQRRIADEERRARNAAQQDAEESAESERADETDDDNTPTPVASGSGRGAKALAFARRQLGKPYRYSAAGPDAYDCSGLTGAAWRSVGVSLPRSSSAQYSGRPLCRQVRSAAGGPGVLLQPHQPRGALRRQRHDPACAAPG